MQPIKIGITGGIGSGKSLICRIFGVLGVPVFNADDEAKRLMVSDGGLIEAIKKAFGPEAYHADGSLNRGYLAQEVFGNAEKLEMLNELVHPVVIRAGEEWAARQETAYTIKEAALLFESGSYKLNRYNVLVVAPEALRIQRVVERDGITAEHVSARMAKQWTDEEKRKLSDFVIVNDGKQAVVPQVLKLDRIFRSQQ
jgi:dephospho-CoA kinase